MALSSLSFLTNDSESKKPSKYLLWCRPTFAPEQGVLLVLFGSFLTGASLAQQWNQWTNLALLCVFFALQVEHPYVVQLKQRRTWKPRFLIWGGIYGISALSLAVVLWFHSPVLLPIYLLAIAALIADGVAVLHQKHKCITNELISFAAICLASPLAYGATTGNLSMEAFGMWILNTLFFSSAIYTIKLRKKRTQSLTPGIIYHGLSALIIVGLYELDCLSLITALSFAVVLIKFGIVNCVLEWYRQAKFQAIAIFETRFALVYTAIACISVLPAHLPPR
ncbi:YwiC-like family protein [Crocosphaera sp. Alani8]|uniref:YwiC-like family protein n=1 Tax=Crocosphaera sp. Alani8 TaxID=3038952 RepID=UPI00313EB15D